MKMQLFFARIAKNSFLFLFGTSRNSSSSCVDHQFQYIDCDSSHILIGNVFLSLREIQKFCNTWFISIQFCNTWFNSIQFCNTWFSCNIIHRFSSFMSSGRRNFLPMKCSRRPKKVLRVSRI